MEADSYSSIILLFFDIHFFPVSMQAIAGILVFILLLIVSALISGSEVACFSLSPVNIEKLKSSTSKRAYYLLELLERPQRLLATILITNNFVNVGIVILSTLFFVYDTSGDATKFAIIDFSATPTAGVLFQVVVVTFLLLLFGEIIPKVYANQYAMRFSSFMAYPLLVLEKIFRPISTFLIKSTAIVNNRIQRKQNISIDDLSDALALTSGALKEDKKILQGIVSFGNIPVKSIMKPRVDISAIDSSEQPDIQKLCKTVSEWGYSRIPVYDETFDNIKGILYTKDLLPHLEKQDSFDWLELLRPPYFVPETKKINDLLEEFQSKKIHLAIVIDEYGGTSGIVTLEDILEEIVGEISDEYDEDEIAYSKLDDKNYIFEGKILLNDLHKIIGTEADIFDDIKGDADTLAGIILEMIGDIPQKNQIIDYRNFSFQIVAVDNRRIKKIKVTLK